MTIGPIAPVSPVSLPMSLGATSAVNPGGGAGFAATLASGLDNLQAVQSKADDLAVQAATGTLTDVHDYMIAATEATLTTQLTVAVRNKALEAFSEIMRMQA
jgi:flagellar hook-basal body complex protein FliE